MAAIWEALHRERLVQVHGTERPDASPFEALVTAEEVELVLAYIGAGRGDLPLGLVDAELWPTVEVAENGTHATVVDCIFVSSRLANEPDAELVVRTREWTGAAVETSGGWRITTLNIGRDRCVPAGLNRELLDAYHAYHTAWTTAWDPPDPNHPLLDETMIGDQLDDVRRALEADRAAGIVLRDPHDPLPNAVVVDLGMGSATVSDCHEAARGYGAFDRETGERLDEVIAPVHAGQDNLTTVELVRTDGGWRVAQADREDATNCRPHETPYFVAP